MPSDLVHIKVGNNVVDAEKLLYDMTISKFKNYHSIVMNLPILLITPFLGLLIQSFNLVNIIPYAPFWALFIFLVFFGTIYALAFNKLNDTEQFLKRGCVDCILRKTLQQEIIDFIRNFALP